MKSDNEIKVGVEEELRWEPGVEDTDVAAAVKSGVVTLTGFVPTFSDKFQAEIAAKRVAGVRGVANDIEVRLRNFDERTDPDIARDAVNAIKMQVPAVADNIQAVVDKGWIKLEGTVEWWYQKTLVTRAVEHLRGVKGVDNRVTVKPRVKAFDVKQGIEKAFRRNAELDAAKVKVQATDGAIVLTGSVRSWFEHDEAQRAAWAAPGVATVDNRITVQP